MTTSVGPQATKIINDIKTLLTPLLTLITCNQTGKGCILQDIDGNNFLDFTSNIGSCPLGYSH
jgi:4-aminobutyrate aminotransferase